MNSLFPAKLYPLVHQLSTSKVWANKQRHTFTTVVWQPIKCPDDQMERVVMRHPSVVKMLPPEHRARMAYGIVNFGAGFKSMHASFEIYDQAGDLISTTAVVDLEEMLALAVEVELLTDLLQEQGLHVTTM